MTDFHDDIKWGNMLERRRLYWFYDKIPFALKAMKTLIPPLFGILHDWTCDNIPKQYYFITEQPLEESRSFMQPTVGHIEKIKDQAAELGAGFALFVLPRAYQYSDRECPDSWDKHAFTVLGPYALEPFRFFAELKDKVDYPIHSLLPAFQETDLYPTCFKNDPHWNEDGAGVAAEAIADALEEMIKGIVTSGDCP